MYETFLNHLLIFNSKHQQLLFTYSEGINVSNHLSLFDIGCPQFVGFLRCKNGAESETVFIRWDHNAAG